MTTYDDISIEVNGKQINLTAPEARLALIILQELDRENLLPPASQSREVQSEVSF